MSDYLMSTLMLIDGKLCQWIPRLARFRVVPQMTVISDMPIPSASFRGRRAAEKYRALSSMYVSEQFGMPVEYVITPA